MSRQNQSTLEVYERFAEEYLAGGEKHQQANPEKQAKKRAQLKNFIYSGLEGFPKTAEILEFGSASGEDVELFTELGFQVTPSDAPESFLRIMQEKGLHPLKLNVLTDDFPQKYDIIYSWRTLVHFTAEDTKQVFEKVYRALKPGGRYIFNILNAEGHNQLSEEWMDYEGDYHIGQDRYFRYWQREDLVKLLQRTGFAIKRLETGGGNDDKRWFYIIVEKPKEKTL